MRKLDFVLSGIFLVIVFCCFFAVRKISQNKDNSKEIVYKERIIFKHDTIVKRSAPVEVIKYLKPDTILRNQIETEKIILNVKNDRKNLEISTIDTKGIVSTQIYHLPKLFYTVEIDNSGDVKIKKKFVPRLIIGIVSAAVIVSSYFLLSMKKHRQKQYKKNPLN